VPHTVTLVLGDSPGPEVTKATRKVPDATGVEFNWETRAVGQATQHIVGTPLPDNTFESIMRPSRVI